MINPLQLKSRHDSKFKEHEINYPQKWQKKGKIPQLIVGA